MRFHVQSTVLDAVKVLERRSMADQRGSFSRLFDADELAALGWTQPVAQVNHSVTAKRGSLRGMHYQLPPHAEMKLVTCIRGAVLDVALDVRAGSNTLSRWHGEHLTADNQRALLIPAGFAHGFQTLSDDVELIYCHSAPYQVDSEVGHNALDPLFSIEWPDPITEISKRDQSHPMLDGAFRGVAL